MIKMMPLGKNPGRSRSKRSGLIHQNTTNDALGQKPRKVKVKKVRSYPSKYYEKRYFTFFNLFSVPEIYY